MKPTTLNPCPLDDDSAINLRGNTWLVSGPTNVGVWVEGGEAWLVDSGNDKEAGRKLNRMATDRGWRVAGIVNTHSNADHAGGNAFLQGKADCRIVATVEEAAFIEAPEIEAAFLWGGSAPPELRNKFFEAKPSRVTDRVLFPPAQGQGGSGPSGFRLAALPAGLSAFPVPGHFFGMIGVLTPDRVAFLGDCLFGEAVLAKYGIPFIYNVAAFRDTLALLPSLEADIFVPSHGPVLRGRAEVESLAARNLERVDAVGARAFSSVADRGAASFDEVLSDVATAFGLRLDAAQYALVGCTVRSFLTDLYRSGRIVPDFAGNRLSWRVARIL